MTQQQRIAVIGGGMGGLTAGVLLQRAGFEATVYEQAKQLARIGAGINIYPNGMHVLRATGVVDHLLAIGQTPATWFSRVWDTGELLYSQPEAAWHKKFGEPHIILHRGDLQRSLASQLRPDSIQFDKHLVGIEEVGDALKATFADGSSVEADVIIGADGVNSRVRELLLGPQPPKYSGFVAYRSVFPASRLSRPLDSDGCKFWSDDRHWANEDRHMIIYYTTKAKDEVYFVTGSPDPNWEGTTPVDVTIQEVKDHYAGFHDEVQRVIDASVRISKWPLLTRDPLPLWSSGRIVLLGDACHPMKPHMGQGAGMAFEDAAVLARCLQEKRDDIEGALKLYEANRQGRASKVQRISNANTFLKYEEDPTWCFGYNAMTVPLQPAGEAAKPPQAECA
ncbi:FAD-dependent monooxygenase [Cupriavidus necator]